MTNAGNFFLGPEDSSPPDPQPDTNPSALSPPETVSIYILAGQSNAERAEVRYSIEEALLEKGENYVLITDAYGGKTLASKAYYPDWNPASTGEYFDALKAHIASVVADIEASGKIAKINGLLWVQGEADAVRVDWANKYAANLQSLVDATHNLYGDDFQFAIAQLSSESPNLPFHMTVRQAQELVAAANTNVALLNTDDLDFISDGVHYDLPSRAKLAQMFVDLVTENSPGPGAPDPGTTVVGTAAADILRGGSGDDVVDGGANNDALIAGAGNDTLYGGGNNDILVGGAGNDILYGGKNSDSLLGGEGDDFLNAGTGIDIMSGGRGADVFAFDVTSRNSHATIYDFNVGVDSLQLNGIAVASLSDTADGAKLYLSNGADVTLTHVQVADLSGILFF